MWRSRASASAFASKRDLPIPGSPLSTSAPPPLSIPSSSDVSVSVSASRPRSSPALSRAAVSMAGTIVPEPRVPGNPRLLFTDARPALDQRARGGLNSDGRRDGRSAIYGGPDEAGHSLRLRERDGV